MTRLGAMLGLCVALVSASADAASPAPAAKPASGGIPEETPARARRPAGLGLSLEGLMSLLFEDDPQGGPFVRQTGWGLRAGWDVSGPAGLGDTRWTLQPELQWTSRSDSEGTRAVTVERRLDSFFLGARFGRRFGDAATGLRVVPYLVAGPAATSNRVKYKVADPVGARSGVSSTSHDASDLQWGAGYGGGIGASWFFTRG
ncbi:MAG TPA: hypothetical protein VGD74_12625, partial [Vulgatibacter sp.]